MSLLSGHLDTLRDLYLNELRDLHSAETQLVEALPRMEEAATNAELKRAFARHLEQTRRHVQRLEEIFGAVGARPAGELCAAMQGLVNDGEKIIATGGNAEVRDAALIGVAQRIEHYEIAAYGAACALATRLGHPAAADLLQETLNEESETDELLARIAAEDLNERAARIPLV